MSTSFIINLGDLNKILEQIKVAERHAAGENLVDIIGTDAALLPVGLRTVDGSFNHLLPGDTRAGAADELFPRLLTPTFINDADADMMPLGPPPFAPVVTNTNYDPTIGSSSNPAGVHVHSVADADPRIISNLIVDQTLNNRSALVAALTLSEAADPSALADQIIAARAAAAAAAPFAAATAAAYADAVTGASDVQTQLLNALANLSVLRQDAATDSVVNDSTKADDAVTAATAALNAATAVLTALQAPGTTVAAADLASAQAQVDALTTFLDDVTAVQGIASGGVIVPEYEQIVLAQTRAQQLVTVAQQNAAALLEAETNPAAVQLTNLIEEAGLDISNDGSILIEHRSADIGLSPPNSAWMTFFGQFFDHGLDLVTKGNNGTIYIPLQEDDPLIAGADHIRGNADDLPAHLRFMTLTRATTFDADGNPSPTGTETQNTTTPFVDQNQTYTSNASHQVFLREYRFTDTAQIDTDGDGIGDTTIGTHAVNTGHLLNGVNHGIANWSEVKAQAVEKLGLLLNDSDVLDVPQLLVDPYGKFMAGTNGYAQVVVTVFENNGTTTRISQIAIEGKAGGLDIHHITPADLPPGFEPLDGVTSTVFQIVGTNHAFLNDIAHTAVPVVTGGELRPDADSDVGNPVPMDAQGHNTEYDDELLDRHFVTGDGRGNENIGLTAVHNIFHSEHNRLAESNKDTLIASGDAAVVSEWLMAAAGGLRNGISQVSLDAINAMTDSVAKAAAIDGLNWDGERLFQAARFVTEMQYQHLVFEEFARRIQPNVDPFVFTNSADLDPAIVAEFAHTVYRFGHSMLVDSVDRLDNDLSLVNSDNLTTDDAAQIGLIEAFLNPVEFTRGGVVTDAGGNFAGFNDETATGALVRGMSRSVGNEIDEFVVEALRNNLLGLPLDLPALNIARGRETGVPTLNDARAQIFAMTGAADLKPYTSWVDYAQHLKHPLSVVNFIAAYGTHSLIANESTSEGKRAAAMAIVFGTSQDVPANSNMHPPVLAHTIAPPADRLDFLNATGDHAPDGAGPHDDSRGGLNKVDLWIGGLAEELNEFGGQLGSTFNFVFEYQLEHLQNGDRFYYLSRTQGMNLLNMLEPNTFTDLVMRNTDLGDLHSTHLPGALMSVDDMIFELDREAGQQNYSGDPLLDGTDPVNRSDLDPKHDDAFLQAIDPKVLRVEGTARMNGSTPVLDADGKQIFDGGILKFSGGEHVVLGGTEGNDTLLGDKGIDTLWGDGGDDYLNAGMESDQVFGGDGDDIIEDPFGDNFLRGEGGDDVVSSDSGLSILFGGDGQDFLEGVTDFKEVFAGPGNDFILGGTDSDALMGNEGDDWIEGGEGFDDIAGGNSELFFNSIIDGHDILNGQGNDTDYDGENGDDIMVDGPGIQRNNGMDGFDWTIFKGDNSPVDADLGIRPFETRQALILRDRFDSVEGLSGWKNDDILTGASKLVLGENFADALTQAGVDRIHGLRTFLGPVIGADTGNPNDVVFESDLNAGGEIILGGDGSDTIRGNLGNDILDGDAWLNVRISVHAGKDASGPTGPEIATFDGLGVRIAWTGSGLPDSWQQLDSQGAGTGMTKTLSELMHARLVNPGQLEAVREILTDTTDPLLTDAGHDHDIAVFSDIRSNYTIETVTPGGAIGDGDGDGFIAVAHTPVVTGGGGGLRDSDGIDKIRNFEILSFADGNIFLDPTIDNHAAAGFLQIAIIDDAQPGTNVGDTFTVNLGSVTDADGPLPDITAFTFSWEFEATLNAGDWEPVTDPVTGDPITGRTFTPTPDFALDGLRLRVVGRFTDAEGVPEVVFSRATDALGAQAVATATAGDDLLVGTNGADFINALAGDDEVNALGGDDVVIGGPGSDLLDGGAGTDTAVFFAPLANFAFELNAEGLLEAIDATTAEEDVVNNFETLVFINSPSALTDAQVAAIVAGGPPPAGVTVERRTVAEITQGVFINDDANGNMLTGTEFSDFIFGNDGDDIIDGVGGSDLLSGGDGDDDIDSGGGIVSGGNSTAAGNTIRLRAGDETLLVGLGENGSDIVRNDRGTERISIGAVAVAVTVNQTGSVVALPGGIGTLTAVDDGAGNLLLTVDNKTVTVTDHFNDADNAVELMNFNGSSFAGLNLGALDYNLVAAAAGVTTLNGGAGNDAVFGSASGETLSGGVGNDVVLAGGGNDFIVWSVGDGRDLVHGGLEAAGVGDTFVVNGTVQTEFYRIYSTADGSAAAAGLTGLSPGAEIVITRSTSAGPVTNANIIAELAEIEEIVINTGGGSDNVQIVGNFNASHLHVNTITVNDDGGATTVDVTHLNSAHHVALHSTGNDDSILGARPQDEIIPVGSGGGGNGGGGNGGGGNGGGGNGGGGDDVAGNGEFELTASDVDALKKLVNGQQAGEDNDAAGIRDLEGTGNNRAHPGYGSADQPFIRITDPHYGAYNPSIGNNNINPLFSGLDPRAISNALGTQEAGLATSAQGVNALFTAFGQYFDHGLDFLGKGGNGSIQIGAPGAGHTPGTDNPADLTRGSVDRIVNGVPQHLNKTSPFVDQNQAYGSNELVGQFLREGDGHGGFSGRLLAGGPDPSNPDFNLLPNLREVIQHHWNNNTVFEDESLPGGHVAFRTYFAGLVNGSGVINESMLPAMASNFMGSGFPLLLDTNPFINLLDHYVAGDGRANENIALTSIHTIWARNHNFHVESLIDAGFTGTSEELFQAAKLINETEYQRVVFTEFADHLLGGIKGDGEHGFDEYNPNVDARISHEFATAAYRFGHSLINQTMTVLDAQGNPTSVSLFDAFLNPTNDPSAFPVDPSAFYTPKPGYEQLGIKGILAGAVTQAAEEVDVNIVDAVRNDLVRTSADVFALDVARTWDVGLGSLNQVRADLLASTDPYVHEAVGFAGDLTPYTSWEDFQARNNLSNAIINQFKAAYPDLVLAASDIAAFQAVNPDIQLGGPNHDTVRGIDRVDLFVGGLAESHINGGVVGQTFWTILHEQFDRLQEGDRFYYLERVENLDFYDIVEEQGFAAIIARNTGLTNLPEDIFATNLLPDANDDDDDHQGNDDDDDDDHQGNDDDNQPPGDDDDDDNDGDDDGSGDGTTTPPPLAGAVVAGTPQTDVLNGTAGDDNIVAFAGDDVAIGYAGDDAMSGGEGADFMTGGAGRDVMIGGAGDDQLFGGGEADLIYGDAGADRMFGDLGNDMMTGGAGDDQVFGGRGNDLFVSEIGDGNDVYFGDDSDGGDGIDTIDYSAATSEVHVNLGGAGARGSANGSQTGNDLLWGIENVNTGSGNDTIVAGVGRNVMDGGAGNDTFKFPSVAAANGDLIRGFEPGDRIDLSAIDANTGTAANDSFMLVSGAEFTAAGQLAVSFESRADGDFTVIQGNVDGNLNADFRVEVEGHHAISGANVTP